MRSALGRLGARALNALLPPACLTCDDPVEQQGTQCAACFARLSLLVPPCCDLCGVPFGHAGLGPLCPGCEARRPAFARARAALRYDEGARDLILPFKYGDRSELAGPLARQMLRAGARLLAEADLLAPVPLHWRRLQQRRYNQAALLAGHLARATAKPCIPDLLRRIRQTPPLGERGAAERATLLEGVFAVTARHRSRVAGQRVLLVDDVVTSGATGSACAEALLAAGAASVDLLAAARVPDPRLEAPPD